MFLTLTFQGTEGAAGPVLAPAFDGVEGVPNAGVDEGFAEEDVDAPLEQEDALREQPHFLLEQPEPAPVPPVEEAAAPGGFGFVLGGGLGAAHQALLLRDSPTEFHPYHSPKWFYLKV